MRFLPVFLDLQSGMVLLVGAGDLARAKLRLLAAAGARVRWFATDDQHDLTGLDTDEASRIELAAGDPLTADLAGVIAILCAGAGDIGPAMSARANEILQAASDNRADARPDNETLIVAADQLNDVDRSLHESNPPAATSVISSANPPAAPVVAGNQENSSWDQTSLIGKIFIGFGALLTVASAARMFMA